MRPSVGSVSFAISDRSVLLPQPDGPIRETNSPRLIVSVMGSRPRAPLAKTLSTPEDLDGGVAVRRARESVARKDGSGG